ncbi:hypothetical protein [Microbacterium sp. 5K110]|uniref:hypothetical protein n=1 Tax=Microbacterium sp. 5K110 TaxID=2578104 RepID=UPI0010FE0CBD|nr:hypothetical protein [Microbacterium sp. 5K110]TLF33210.1 hypothetical protein FE256_03700 [Microbacterium sp. 5K110]
MEQSTRPAFTGISITAITLGAVGLLIVIVLFPAAKIVGAVLGAAAVIVGVLAAVNARRAGAPWVAPVVGAVFGLVAVVWMLIVAATL